MSSGKAIAQAGHAFLGTFLKSLHDEPALADQYGCLNPGTKITLAGGSAADLERLHQRLCNRGLPSALIVDRDHIELPDFDGSPTLTALGVGPISRAEARRLLGKFSLWPDLSKNGGG
jgi:peptidyl-tRNA hydrolase